MQKKVVVDLMDKYDYEVDNEGQILFYTGWYEHSDGELRDEPEEEEEEE